MRSFRCRATSQRWMTSGPLSRFYCDAAPPEMTTKEGLHILLLEGDGIGPISRFQSNWINKRGYKQRTSKFLALSFHNFAFLGLPCYSLKIPFLLSSIPTTLPVYPFVGVPFEYRGSLLLVTNTG